MAWFDYAAALGRSLGQGAQEFRGMRQQQRAEARQARLDQIAEETRQREQLKEQLALMDPTADLSPEEAAPYIKAFGKGAFAVSPTDATRVRRRQAPSEELAGMQLEDTRVSRKIRQDIESGKIDITTQPLDKALNALARAGLEPAGRLSTAQTREFIQRNAAAVEKYEAQMRELANKAALAEMRAQSAMATAGERARLAEEQARLKERMAALSREAAAARANQSALLSLYKVRSAEGQDTSPLLDALMAAFNLEPTVTQD